MDTEGTAEASHRSSIISERQHQCLPISQSLTPHLTWKVDVSKLTLLTTCMPIHIGSKHVRIDGVICAEIGRVSLLGMQSIGWYNGAVLHKREGVSIKTNWQI